MSVSFPELQAIRLGFGLSPLMAPVETVAEVLDSVTASTMAGDGITLGQAREAATRLSELGKARRQGDGTATGPYRDFLRELGQLPMVDLRRRLARAVDAPAGVGERLVQFWADHFTVRANAVGVHMLRLAFVDEAIR
ncbi:MAG: DUF1800 family protein, partial [Paracoccus sp. (in: a-proteobacteria)]